MRCLLFLCYVSTIIFHNGCNGKVQPVLQPVTATITLDGQPAQGTFTLYPIDTKSSLKSAGGHFKDGKFSLTRDNGAAAGEYNVLIILTEKIAGSTPPSSVDQNASSDVDKSETQTIELGRYSEKVIIKEQTNDLIYKLTKQQLSKDIEL